MSKSIVNSDNTVSTVTRLVRLIPIVIHLHCEIFERLSEFDSGAR